MAKSQIVELKDKKIVVTTYKNGVLLQSEAPHIEVMSDGAFVMGCTRTSREAMNAVTARFGNGAPGIIQQGYVVADQRREPSDLASFVDSWVKKNNYHEWMCGNTDLSAKDAARMLADYAGLLNAKLRKAEDLVSRYQFPDMTGR